VATDRESEASTQPESGVSLTLPHDFLRLPVRERREIVWSLASRRSRHRESTAEAVMHAYEDGEPAVVPALTVALEVDPDTHVKRHAAFGLGCIPEQAVVPVLRGALASKDRATKGHAILALGRLRAREALPDLAVLLDDTYARFLAADALVAIADEQALAALRQAASHGSPLRRHRLRKRVSALETTLGTRGST
jgi:HEAT repeat protein